MTQEILEREIQGKIKHYKTTFGDYIRRCNKVAAYVIPTLNKGIPIERIAESISLKDLAGISQDYEEILRSVEELYATTIAANQIASIYRSQTKQSLPEDVEGFLKRNCRASKVKELLETQRQLSAISADLNEAMEEYKEIQEGNCAQRSRNETKGRKLELITA